MLPFALLFWGGLTSILSLVSARSTGDAFCTSLICCSAVRTNGQITYTLRRTDESIAAASPTDDWFGWIGLGFGTTMANSPMVIVWPNPENGFTISQRFATSQVEPTVQYTPSIGWAYLVQEQSVLNLTHSSISFIVEDKDGKEDVRDVIWAYGSYNPRSTDISATLQQHEGSGTASLDFSKLIVGSEASTTNLLTSTGAADSGATAIASQATGYIPHSTTAAVLSPTATRSVDDSGADTSSSSLTSSSPYTSHQQILIAHAVFGGLGMMVFLPFGVVLARLARGVMSRWVRWHWIIHVALSFPSVVIAFALGVSATNDSPNASHFQSSHRKLGLALLILLPIQLSFGYLIHRQPQTLPTLSIKSKPIGNILHPLGGVVILILGWCTVYKGFEEWEEWSGLGSVPDGVRVVFGILVGLFALLYLGGLSLIPRQNRLQNLQQNSSSLRNSASSANRNRPSSAHSPYPPSFRKNSAAFATSSSPYNKDNISEKDGGGDMRRMDSNSSIAPLELQGRLREDEDDEEIEEEEGGGLRRSEGRWGDGGAELDHSRIGVAYGGEESPEIEMSGVMNRRQGFF